MNASEASTGCIIAPGNFSQVESGVYRSACPDSENISFLKIRRRHRRSGGLGVGTANDGRNKRKRAEAQSLQPDMIQKLNLRSN